MSRNLCSVRCPRCETKPVLDEEPRPLREIDAGMYFEQFEGMLVADATCPLCGARLLAWIDERPRKRPVAFPRHAAGEAFDLSWRSTFNDEPGENEACSEIWPLVEAYGRRKAKEERYGSLAEAVLKVQELLREVDL